MAVFPLPVKNMTSHSAHFLKDAKISAIREHLRHISNCLIFAWVFRTSWPKMGVLGWENRGRRGAILTPITNSFFLLRVLTVTSVPILVKIDQEMRVGGVLADGQTCRQTDANRFYTLPHAIYPTIDM